jgi:hypothetical protein
MSILSSTNSGIHQPITYDSLVKEGYITSDTHALKIGRNGAVYELSKRIGETVYKAYIYRKVEDFNISYRVLHETYTFYIKTIKDLKSIEKYWDNPSPKALYDLQYTIENKCSITSKS